MKTPEMRAKEAQLKLFELLRRKESPSMEEALTAVKSVFTTADLARNRPAEVLKASNLFSSRHGGFCREITVRVLRELHGNRHYSHLPWVTAAYGRVVKGGKEHGLEILPAQECERALSHEAA